MHVVPEYSTLIDGGAFANQMALIESIARNIPHDWIVYVKEHPAMAGKVVRSKKFYDRLKEMPNVKLAPVTKGSLDIIKNSEMVATVRGTEGWEAILEAKPVLTFADFLFDVLGLSKKCENLDNLSNIIRDELENNKKIKDEERKKRILTFISAMLEHSFEISYPEVFFYIDEGTEDKYEICGKELASGFIRHLKKKN